MAADELTDWTRGDPLTAAHLQQPVSVLRKMLGRPGGQIAQQRFERGGFTFVVTLGQIVDTGPGGESDFTTEQYFVKPQFIQGDTTQTDPITLADITPPDEHTEDSEPEASSNIRTVTNLAELQHGTHNLEIGRYVWFFAVTDGQDNPADHFLMSEYAAPACTGTDTSTIGDPTEGTEAADTTSFDPTAGAGTNTGTLELWVTRRVGYFEAGDQKLYGYAVKLTFTCGGNGLPKVSGETRYEIDPPVDCTTS